MMQEEKHSLGEQKTAKHLKPDEVVIAHALTAYTDTERSTIMSGLGNPILLADDVAAESLKSGLFTTVRILPFAFIPATGRKLARHSTVVGVPASS